MQHKSLEHRRRMKYKDRKDDVPDCPELESLEFPDPVSSDDDEICDQCKAHGKQNNYIDLKDIEFNQALEKDFMQPQQFIEPSKCTRTSKWNLKGIESSKTTPRRELLTKSSKSDEIDVSFRSQPQQFNSLSSNNWSETSFPRYTSNSTGPRGQLIGPNGSKLLGVIGNLILELSVYAFALLRHYPTPCAIGLILGGGYFFINYLESALAASVELLTSFAWPLSHIWLRMLERFFTNLSSMSKTLDDLGQSFHCDLSMQWCSRFGLMCDKQCSFMSMALERLRDSN